MGQRSSTATVFAIVHAFIENRTWSQAELARHLEMSVPALRKRLLELEGSGVPLERQEDHPNVWWSVPKTWFPGAVVLKDQDVVDQLRILARTPKSPARDRLIASISRQLPTRADTATRLADAIVPPDAPPVDERYLAVLEDSAAHRQTVRMRYLSAVRGFEKARHVSVHRVVSGPPVRFIATCHRTGTLKWFRADNVIEARLDHDEPFRATTAAAVTKFQSESINGFHQAGPAESLAFFVRDPESRWVAKNLLPGMQVEDVDSGIRVVIATTAIMRVASYVVGLGAAARAETPALIACVTTLAKGALAASGNHAAAEPSIDSAGPRTRRSRRADSGDDLAT